MHAKKVKTKFFFFTGFCVMTGVILLSTRKPTDHLQRVVENASRLAKQFVVPPAKAAEAATQLQTMRTFFWLVMGFPSASDFTSSGIDSTSLAGKDGIVGRVEAIRETIVDIVQSTYNPASCKTFITEDRTLTMTSGATLTFAAAKLSAPSGFPTTGKYDKRVTYQGKDSAGDVDLTAAFEFFCEYSAMAAVFTEKVGDDTQNRYAIFYDRPDEGEQANIDFYMHGEKDFVSTGDLSLALQVRIDESAQTFKSWLTRTSSSPRPLGYRYAVHANYETQQNSFMAIDVAINSADALSVAQWAAASAVADNTVTGLVAPSQAATTNAVKLGGCAENFDVNLKTTMTSASTCAELPLSEADAPVLDSSGNMSLKWVEGSLSAKLSAL